MAPVIGDYWGFAHVKTGSPEQRESVHELAQHRGQLRAPAKQGEKVYMHLSNMQLTTCLAKRGRKSSTA